MTGALFALSSMAQTIEVIPEYGTAYGGGVEVDLTNNGHLDLLFGGLGKTKHYLPDADGNDVETEKYTWFLAYNPTTKKFEKKETNLLAGDRPNFKVADFNGDGIMDILLTEHGRDIFYKPGIYIGKGDGTFEKQEMTFDDPSFEFRPVAVNVADFNNDGLVDIVAIGYETVGGVKTNRSAVLINKGNYQFDVTNVEMLGEYQLALVFVKVFDYNNDGYMDFIVSGNCDNCISGSHLSYTEIFANLGEDAPGEFYPLSIGDGMVKTKALGGLDIADFNGDGWLDFAIHGEGVGTGEPSSGDKYACVSHVYINQKNGTFADRAQANFPPDIRPLNTTGISTRTIDWDGDGSYDLFVGGWNPNPTGTQAGFYYLNNGAGTFGAGNRIPGGSELSILFPDWNGDGKRDYFMTGQSWDNAFYTEEQKGRTSAVVLNAKTSVNERPNAPTGLNTTINKDKVTLKWNAATDKETPAAALSYEFYLKRNGKLYNSCLSHIGGSLDGVRKVLDHGNAMLNKSITLYDLPDGAYEWGVQAIDASYDGSVFANGTTFIIGEGNSIEDVEQAAYEISSSDNILSFGSQLPATVNIFSIAGVLIDSRNEIQSFTTTLAQGVYIVKVTFDNKPESVRRILIK